MFGIAEYVFVSEMFWSQRKSIFENFNSGGWRKRLRTYQFFMKFFKIHGITFAGLWIPFGGVMLFFKTVTMMYCKERSLDDVCVHLTHTLAMGNAAMILYSGCMFLFFVSAMLCVVSYCRMMEAIKHFKQNAGDPEGHFAGNLFDTWTQVPKRPIQFGVDRRFSLSVIQLMVEYMIWGLPSAIVFGTLPGYMAITKIMCYGHTMKYIVATKPGGSNEPQPTGETHPPEASKV
jgi:hypothetical protein